MKRGREGTIDWRVDWVFDVFGSVLTEDLFIEDTEGIYTKDEEASTQWLDIAKLRIATSPLYLRRRLCFGVTERSQGGTNLVGATSYIKMKGKRDWRSYS